VNFEVGNSIWRYGSLIKIFDIVNKVSKTAICVCAIGNFKLINFKCNNAFLYPDSMD